MNIFYCHNCSHQVFFENTKCQHCGARVGYQFDTQRMGSFVHVSALYWRSLDPNQHERYYRPCYNYHHHGVCNWMISSEDDAMYCRSCQLTHTIPDLSVDYHVLYWRRLEQAKRRFLYLCQQLNIMPFPKQHDDDLEGLRFNFLMPLPDYPVLTGHADGIITLNASEADVVHREKTRLDMGEKYRTLLGHFRHESGHYFFDVLDNHDPTWLPRFRELFGDDNADYEQALEHYYINGAPKNWQKQYISRYACAHPWEDFAETWAHYLHMMDTLDSAFHSGMQIQAKTAIDPDLHFHESPIAARDFEQVLSNWFALTYALNSLNRSMGLDDAYPFTLSDAVLNKLRFIHHSLMQMAFPEP